MKTSVAGICRTLPACFALAFFGCGGGSPTSPTLTISPTSASTAAGAVIEFVATPVPAETVSWSLASGDTGVLVPNALHVQFHAAAAGTYHVTATGLTSNVAATAIATVTAAPPPDVSVSPTAATVAFGGTVPVSATVTNASNTAVAWSLTETNAGTLAVSGATATLTAGNTVATAHVVAKSVADASRTATSTISIVQCTAPANCAVANGSAGCSVANTCTVASCNTGYKDCDLNPANGCEVNVTSSVNNCGTCGHVCPAVPNATPGCSSSVCGIGTCNAGYADCDLNPANGCEMNVASSVNNCGTCGHVCPAVPNATPGCSSGVCGIGSCNAGYGDCDHNPANGCEVNVTSDVNNCGACGHVCALPNATPACSSSACRIVACNPGYADCNAIAADGCEVNITQDPNNCGGCGHVCTAGRVCTGGTCV
jgi:hypothetical protein